MVELAKLVKRFMDSWDYCNKCELYYREVCACEDLAGIPKTEEKET
jgi:hypothetical protein